MPYLLTTFAFHCVMMFALQVAPAPVMGTYVTAEAGTAAMPMQKAAISSPATARKERLTVGLNRLRMTSHPVLGERQTSGPGALRATLSTARTAWRPWPTPASRDAAAEN